MKKILLLIVVCLWAIAGKAQCYDDLLNKGVQLNNDVKYEDAIKKFKGALKCPDKPNNGTQTLNDWIIKAQNPPNNTNAFEPETVFVQGGTFTMGCTSEQGSNCQSDEKPMHQVTLNNFYIGKYEVTQKQWRDVIGTDPSILYNKGCDECPVENVSHDEIQEYLSKLKKKTGKNYRLPTEAEWEFAARGGVKSKGYKYSGSDNINDVASFSENPEKKTHPVGTKAPNELGIYDMTGNVWEWCSDWYGSYSSSSSSNPKGASSGSRRVYRGGGCYYYSVHCRVSLRYSYAPVLRYNFLGFRVAASAL